MKALGLVHIPWLRFVNAGILFTGVFMAIKEVKNSETGFTYFIGLGTGVSTAFFASTLFALFVLRTCHGSLPGVWSPFKKTSFLEFT